MQAHWEALDRSQLSAISSTIWKADKPTYDPTIEPPFFATERTTLDCTHDATHYQALGAAHAATVDPAHESP